MKKSFRNVCKCETHMRIFTASNHTEKLNDMQKVILTINDAGDFSVGVWPQAWEIECPFFKEETNEEDLESFKWAMIQAFAPYCEGHITALYSFETKEID